uniref:hypothetical protein n=1 Tax=Deinococcus sp. Marseille-Q6407 TaxID=2969223 RepID=UPI0021BF3218
MTKPRKKTVRKSGKSLAPRDRAVYEVRGPQGLFQVDAASTKELKDALAPLLGLEPYSVQAAAHLAQVERATVQGNGWSVRRLGTLTFVPDGETQTGASRKGTQQV